MKILGKSTKAIAMGDVVYEDDLEKTVNIEVYLPDGSVNTFSLPLSSVLESKGFPIKLIVSKK